MVHTLFYAEYYREKKISKNLPIKFVVINKSETRFFFLVSAKKKSMSDDRIATLVVYKVKLHEAQNITCDCIIPNKIMTVSNHLINN